jgi:FkbM family methyltransferase
MLSALKQASIFLGVYKPARAIHRILHPSESRDFREHRALLSQFIKPGDLVFDVGANIGIRTEIMLSLDARVVAFEPQPLCAREVRARGNDNLSVVEKAVGSAIGTATLHLKQANVQASLLHDWQGGPDVGSLTVPVTTLDAEIKQFGEPVFCKIDVEGFEAEVMSGLSTPLQSLSFEYHCSDDGVAKMRQIFKRLSEIGDYQANLIGQEDNNWLLPNWLPANEFVSAFPSCASPHYWGDVFCRKS